MKHYTISLSEIYRADELHRLLVDTLTFPEYYGGNLDALYDVLTSQSIGWSLHITDCAESRALLGKYFTRFQKVCLEAQDENPNFEAEFEE